jgi:hypothetical protein
MRWALHGLIIEGTSNDATMYSRWKESFSPLKESSGIPDIKCHIDLTDQIRPPPVGEPIYIQKELLSYYLTEQGVIVHFPDFGFLDLDFKNSTTMGKVVGGVLKTYGLLEDLVAIGLSPHLRRRGFYMAHAFAAATGEHCVLLVGHIGTGKTTVGISLLENGWQLLSNDSPIIAGGGRILSYPGIMAAYPDTLAMFSRIHSMQDDIDNNEKERKVEFFAESLWPGVWRTQAAASLILFPTIEAIDKCLLEQLDGTAALSRFLPHAMERWDKTTISPHLTILRELLESTPSYILHLGRDLESLPDAINEVLTTGR